MTTRTDIIQHFIDQRNFKNYLEIGCFRNENFNKIKIDNKVSVDPDPEAHATYQMTSDEFFANNKDTFDIVFIDGLHEHSQVYKDIVNSLKVLNKDGMIIMHDCLPKTEEMQKWDNKSHQDEEWCGDTWKAYVQAVADFPMYNVVCVTEDYGCGIIDTFDSSDSAVANIEVDMNTLDYQDYLNLLQLNLYNAKPWSEVSKWHYEEF